MPVVGDCRMKVVDFSAVIGFQVDAANNAVNINKEGQYLRKC